MRGRKKQPENTASEEATPDTSNANKKGRATPKRREAEKKNLRPLIPADRKAHKAAQKERRNELYAKQQEALRTGEERYLPQRDQGKARRYVRDWVDARWSLGEATLPLMFLYFPAILLFGSRMGDKANYLAYSVFFFMLITSIEAYVLWMGIKRRFTAAEPQQEIPRGTGFYMYQRMIMPRRWRSPKPQLKRGEYPDKPK